MFTSILLLFRFWLINLSRTTKSTIYMTVGDLNGMVIIIILRIRAASMVMIVPRTYRVVTILIMTRTFKFNGNKNCNFFYQYRFYLIYSASQVSSYKKDPKKIYIFTVFLKMCISQYLDTKFNTSLCEKNFKYMNLLFCIFTYVNISSLHIISRKLSSRIYPFILSFLHFNMNLLILVRIINNQ